MAPNSKKQPFELPVDDPIGDWWLRKYPAGSAPFPMQGDDPEPELVEPEKS